MALLVLLTTWILYECLLVQAFGGRFQMERQTKRNAFPSPMEIKGKPDFLLVDIEGVVWDYGIGGFVSGGNVTVVEKPNLWCTTDKEGRFHFKGRVGEPYTFVFKKNDLLVSYTPTQTSTLTPTRNGLHNVTIQAPTTIVYDFFEMAMMEKADPTKCQLVVTVTARNKTIFDDLQGEPDATVTISPPVKSKPFYFGEWRGKTNPFDWSLKSTSRDGGVLFANVEPRYFHEHTIGFDCINSNEPYVITAHKEGVEFSNSKLLCRPGMLVNASPPYGPKVQ